MPENVFSGPQCGLSWLMLPAKIKEDWLKVCFRSNPDHLPTLARQVAALPPSGKRWESYLQRMIKERVAEWEAWFWTEPWDRHRRMMWPCACWILQPSPHSALSAGDKAVVLWEETGGLLRDCWLPRRKDYKMVTFRFSIQRTLKICHWSFWHTLSSQSHWSVQAPESTSERWGDRGKPQTWEMHTKHMDRSSQNERGCSSTGALQQSPTDVLTMIRDVRTWNKDRILWEKSHPEDKTALWNWKQITDSKNENLSRKVGQ